MEGGKERCEDKVKDKQWEDFFQLETLLVFLLATLPVGEKSVIGIMAKVRVGV